MINRELKAEIVRNYGAQYVFAATMGIREATVSAVVRGKKELDDKSKQEWAKTLNTEVAYLFQNDRNQ